MTLDAIEHMQQRQQQQVLCIPGHCEATETVAMALLQVERPVIAESGQRQLLDDSATNAGGGATVVSLQAVVSRISIIRKTKD